MQTRSSQTGEKLQYNPEIEKLAKSLKKGAKERKKLELESSSSDSNSEIDLFIAGELLFDNPIFQEYPMAAADRTLKELAAPNVNQQPLCITYPALEAAFELKSGLIHLLPSFHGFAGEDPHKHLKKFHVVCSSFRPQGVTEYYIY